MHLNLIWATFFSSIVKYYRLAAVLWFAQVGLLEEQLCHLDIGSSYDKPRLFNINLFLNASDFMQNHSSDWWPLLAEDEITIKGLNKFALLLITAFSGL